MRELIEKMKPLARRLPPGVKGVLRLLVSSRARKDFAWIVWCKFVRLASGSTNAKEYKEFQETGFTQQTLPHGQIDALLESLRNAQPRKFDVRDCLPGYWSNPFLYAKPQELLDGHTFFSLEGELLRQLVPLLNHLQSPVQVRLGHPWRIVNVRCWKTKPGACEMGPNTWHTDGFPIGIFKIMIYLTPPGPTTGTTELRLGNGSTRCVNGPAGTWLLFMNSQIYHRGIAPVSGERIITEVTIVPSRRNDQTPACAGLNASYPMYPWSA